MNDNAIKQIVSDLAKSGDQKYEKSFSVSGKPDEVFTVTVTRKKRIMVTDSISMEALANTISALPSGLPCGYCGGSGKSS
ncbi:hypothetical protein JD522_16725 [Aeromonas hydrophila]|uniref:hypothetical protein n=1 Tax=Aeromonas hydrophila TaxID=644 RepID=UPI0019200403|nr:hypothetical protein [Aeromonas hydrophila]MBL0575050.1 hypothetical protein [Aeromonas hydrophila]